MDGPEHLFRRPAGRDAGIDAIRRPEISPQWRLRGHDQHSLIADPLFVAPEQDDFRLRTNSPALNLGFRPIDLTRVGIRLGFNRVSR